MSATAVKGSVLVRSHAKIWLTAEVEPTAGLTHSGTASFDVASELKTTKRPSPDRAGLRWPR